MGVVAALLIGTGANADTTSARLTFTGVVWNDGSVSSGYFDYGYAADYSLVQITSADITVTAGSSIPDMELVFNVAGKPDNANVGQDYNNRSQRKYEAYFTDKATGNQQIFLDWVGVGLAAMVVQSVPGNYSSITADGNNYISMADAGVSNGTVTPTPEPSSIALAILGGAGCLVRYRRK